MRLRILVAAVAVILVVGVLTALTEDDKRGGYTHDEAVAGLRGLGPGVRCAPAPAGWRCSWPDEPDGVLIRRPGLLSRLLSPQPQTGDLH